VATRFLQDFVVSSGKRANPCRILTGSVKNLVWKHQRFSLGLIVNTSEALSADLPTLKKNVLTRYLINAVEYVYLKVFKRAPMRSSRTMPKFEALVKI
jgi:hypothetical protein